VCVGVVEYMHTAVSAEVVVWVRTVGAGRVVGAGHIAVPGDGEEVGEPGGLLMISISASCR
jgi:hypothetical protein